MCFAIGCVHNQCMPARPHRGGNDDGFHGTIVPNDFIPMSDISVAHRSIYVPLEIAQLDTRVTRLEVITESFSARFDEQKVEFREFRAEMNARFDKVDDRFEKFGAKVDAKFDRVDAKFEQVGIKARSDFHLLFGSLIASTLCLAGMMAKGFGWF